MANIQFSDASFVSNRFIGKIQTAQNVRISVKNDIQSVLSVGVESNVTSYESTAGEASFSGKTNLKVVYFDGTSLSGANYNADFTAAVSSELLTADSKLTFDVVAVDTKVDTNANTATITVLLEVTVYGYITETSPYFQSCDEAYVKIDNIEVTQSADIIDLPTVIDEELTASRNISSVLLAESSLNVAEYVNVNGILSIVGEAVVRLTYVSEGSIVTDVLPFSFNRELDSSEIDPDSQLKVGITPRGTKVRLDISENDVNTNFTVEIAANVRVEAGKVGVLQITADAYGDCCDFSFDKRAITATLPCGSAVATKNVTFSLEAEDGKTPITAVNVRAIVTKCQSGEKCATVDGIVCATLLCSTEAGVEGVDVELPFSQTVDVDYLSAACQSFAKVTVRNFTVRQAGSLTVDAELTFVIDSQRDMTYSVIVSAEEIPFDKKQLPAIEICLAKRGETLWNLAKSMHMSQEDLLASNPDVTNPLEKDTRLVIFNKI